LIISKCHIQMPRKNLMENIRIQNNEIRQLKNRPRPIHEDSLTRHYVLTLLSEDEQTSRKTFVIFRPSCDPIRPLSNQWFVCIQRVRKGDGRSSANLLGRFRVTSFQEPKSATNTRMLTRYTRPVHEVVQVFKLTFLVNRNLIQRWPFFKKIFTNKRTISTKQLTCKWTVVSEIYHLIFTYYGGDMTRKRVI
jgi:hypothetical protein